jgi:hypothetical protein
MPVDTTSSANVVYVNGKPTLVNKADRGGRGGRGDNGYSNRYRCRAQQLIP